MLAVAAAAALVGRRARRVGTRSRLAASGLTARRAMCTPPPVRDRVESWLARADITVSADDALLLWLASAGTLAVLGVAIGGPALAVLAGIAGLGAGAFVVMSRRHRHVDRVREAVPELLETVARELRGGGTVDTAVGRLARLPSPIGREAAALRRRSELGLARHEAYTAWAQSHTGTRADGAMRSAAAALSIATMGGGAAAAPLDALAAAMRDEASVLAEARAHAAQGRLSAILLGSLPAASLALSSLVEPEAVASLVSTSLGRVALVLGLGLDAAGIWWMHRVVRVTP